MNSFIEKSYDKDIFRTCIRTFLIQRLIQRVEDTQNEDWVSIGSSTMFLFSWLRKLFKRTCTWWRNGKRNSSLTRYIYNIHDNHKYRKEFKSALMQISNDEDAHISTKLKLPYEVSIVFMKIQCDNMIEDKVTKYRRVNIHIRGLIGNNSNCFTHSKMGRI